MRHAYANVHEETERVSNASYRNLPWEGREEDGEEDNEVTKHVYRWGAPRYDVCIRGGCHGKADLVREVA